MAAGDADALVFLERYAQRHRKEMEKDFPDSNSLSSDITENDFAWQSFIAHIKNIAFVKTLVGSGISRFAVRTQCFQSSYPTIFDTYFLVLYANHMISKLSLKNEQGQLVAHLQTLTGSTYFNTWALPQRDDVLQSVISVCKQFMAERKQKDSHMRARDLAEEFVRKVGFLTLQLSMEPLAEGKSLALCYKYANRLKDFLRAKAHKHKSLTEV